MSVARAKPSAPSDDKRWRIVETRMRRLGNRPDALIEALHAAQEAFGYLDDDALRYVADTLTVPPSTTFGVATFYHHFTLKPQGEHTCIVCTGTACYINGASRSWPPSAPISGSSPTDDGRRTPVIADRPLPGRLQPRARGDHRWPGRGAGAARRARRAARKAVTEMSDATRPTAARPEPPARQRLDGSRLRGQFARPPTSARRSAACPLRGSTS